VPRDLETIVLKAMARNAGDRYATAQELADDLGRFLRMEPVKARRIGPIGRFWRFAQRHPALVGVSTVAALAVFSIATLAYTRVSRERDRALAAEKQLASALTKEKAATRSSQEARSKELLSQASLLRLSSLPNRRERGRQLLRTAAALSNEPETMQSLRDEVLDLMVVRDVEARPALPTGQAQGLALFKVGTPAKRRLAALSEDNTSVFAWDLSNPSGAVAVETYRLGDQGVAEVPLGPEGGTGRSRGGPGGPGRRGSRIVAVGRYLAVISAEGNGLQLLDPATSEVRVLPVHGSRILAVLAAETTARMLTIEVEPDDAGPREGGPRFGRPKLQVWDLDGDLTPRTLLDTRAAVGPPPPSGAEPPRSPNRFPLAAIDPTGKRIVTGWLGDTTLTVWDAADAQPQGTIDTQMTLTSLAAGPDGLLAAAGDGKIRLWDLDPEPTPLPSLSEHRGLVVMMRFSPDGGTLAVAGPTSGIELWNPAANALVATLPTPERVADLTFLDPGTIAALSGTMTQIWQVVDAPGRARFEFEESPSELAFRSDGLLAIGLNRPNVGPASPRLWQPQIEPTKVHTWEAIQPQCVAFDRGDRLMAVNLDSIDWYSTPLRPPVERLALPEPLQAGFVPRVIRLISQSSDGRSVLMARYLERQGERSPEWTTELLVWKEGAEPPIQRITPPVEGSRRERGGRGNVESRERSGRTPPESRRPENRGERRPGGGPEGAPPVASRGPRLGSAGFLRAALSPNADRVYLIQGGFQGQTGSTLHVWQLLGGIPEPLPWSGQEAATSLALSHDGTILALGRENGGVALLDALTGTPRGEIPAVNLESEDRITTLRFSPDGQRLAVGTGRGVAQIWDVRSTPRRILRLPGQRGFVALMTFDATGQYLALSDFAIAEKRAVEVWDLEKIQRELRQIGLEF
jgi:WD40 repeat protein